MNNTKKTLNFLDFSDLSSSWEISPFGERIFKDVPPNIMESLHRSVLERLDFWENFFRTRYNECLLASQIVCDVPEGSRLDDAKKFLADSGLTQEEDRISRLEESAEGFALLQKIKAKHWDTYKKYNAVAHKAMEKKRAATNARIANASPILDKPKKDANTEKIKSFQAL
tara:strand:- start:201 stop:710 length:510 start_codon:yes stop_codon:yes gene_type:complete